jgi:biopolymer transport protein ExbB
LRELFMNGGNFMWPLLASAVIGVVVFIIKLFSLALAKINTGKFLAKIKDALHQEGVEAAIEICQRTRGPIASIFHAGLLRYDRGVEAVEKAIEETGAIEMSFLERGLVWLATVANIAPMLGFLGTVSGMISAFDSIALAGEIEPSLVASGISEALITTAAGLTIAIPVQAAYNYFVTRIDGFILDMEEASTELVDTLIELEHDKPAVKAKTAKEA